jgi:phosphoribosylformylglycinamidine (FGAM) synthase-like enzyme
VMWQFSEAVAGMGEACRVLETPITGGNVSFYNETDGESIHPTPVVGMLGVLDNIERRVDIAFRNAGDMIVLLGKTKAELGGSEYAWTLHRHLGGTPPELDLEQEKALIDTLVSLAGDGLITAAHDCSEGGLGVTLAEMAIAGNLGARIDPTAPGPVPYIWMFSESASRVVVACSEADLDRVLDAAESRDLPADIIGIVGGDSVTIGIHLDLPVSALAERFESALPEMLR